MMDEKTHLRLLAEIMAGLQVPLSLGAPLGTAKEPYIEMLGRLDSFGYPNADEYETKLVALLTEEQESE